MRPVPRRTGEASLLRELLWGSVPALEVVLALLWWLICISYTNAESELYRDANIRKSLTHRTRYMGFYVFFLQNGAHIAAVVGGYTAKNLGWRWCFWVPAIIFGCNWIVNVFGLPETLYHRNNATGESLQAQNEPWIKRFTFNSAAVGRGRLRLRDFTHVFQMLRYPSVFFPTLYYAISFGVGTVLFAVTGASAFTSIYHFDTAQIGLIIGLPTLIGSLIGEFCSGPVSDRIMYIYTKRHNGKVKPEARLQAMWPGFIIMPIGVIVEGVCFQYHTHWMGPAMGMALGLFGLQIISTNIFAYVADVSILRRRVLHVSAQS